MSIGEPLAYYVVRDDEGDSEETGETKCTRCDVVDVAVSTRGIVSVLTKTFQNGNKSRTVRLSVNHPHRWVE